MSLSVEHPEARDELTTRHTRVLSQGNLTLYLLSLQLACCATKTVWKPLSAHIQGRHLCEKTLPRFRGNCDWAHVHIVHAAVETLEAAFVVTVPYRVHASVLLGI